jgi:hypothetical protein
LANAPEADADNSPDLVPKRRMRVTLRGSVAEKWSGIG